MALQQAQQIQLAQQIQQAQRIQLRSQYWLLPGKALSAFVKKWGLKLQKYSRCSEDGGDVASSESDSERSDYVKNCGQVFYENYMSSVKGTGYFNMQNQRIPSDQLSCNCRETKGSRVFNK